MSGKRYRTDAWPETKDVELRKLWDDGLSSAAIGRIMHKTKNSVISRARRLDLSSRPSPIPRPGIVEQNVPPPSGARRVGGKDPLAPGRGLPAETMAAAPSEPSFAAMNAAMLAAAARPVVAPRCAAPPATHQHGRGCCWPTWANKDGPYWEAITAGRYVQCDAPRPLGQRYCHEHMRISAGGKGNAPGTVSKAFALR